MSGESPARDPHLFDSIEFDGLFSPGVVTLSGHDREQNFDVKESDGQKGATTTWKGTKVGGFTATFRLAFNAADELDDFGAWDFFVERLWDTIPPKSTKPAAKDINHPDLARNGIRAATVKKIGGLQHDGKGGATVAVEFLEYYPPKPAKTGTPAGAKKQKEDPNDPLVKALKVLDETKAEAFGP
jgi:hypothetical protein